MGDIRRWFKYYKSTLECTRCGEDHPSVLEFHHINPAKKLFGISKAVGAAKNFEDIKKIRRELKKCIAVCSNCHRKIHWEMQRKR